MPDPVTDPASNPDTNPDAAASESQGGTPDERTSRRGPLARAADAVWSFSAAAVPHLARRNYRFELVSSFYLPFLLAVVDSTIISVVAKNAFEGRVAPGTLNIVVAILTASTAFSNIVSFVWVRLAHGRDKIRFINALQLAMVVLVAAVGLVPITAEGLWLLVALVIAARFCWAGFLTLRTTVWRQNYTREARARVTGKLATIQSIAVAVLGFGLGLAMEVESWAFRVFFPLGAMLALTGVWAWGSIRVRGHRELLARERASAVDGDAPSFNPSGMVRLLADDRRYAGYMGCMMLLGLGNLMVPPVLVIALRDVFGLAYLGGIAIANSLPLLMMPLSIPLWARLLDRVHVIEFRAIHAWVFVTATVIDFVAVLSGVVEFLYVSSAIRGLAFGGGALAWNLGHMDFAPAHRASEYMGVHVTLTGVRGLMAPFLAVGLWKLFESISPGAGAWTFFVCAILCVLGGLGFLRMRRSLRADVASGQLIDPERRADAAAAGPKPENPR